MPIATNTIAAIATPLGEGGLAVLRLSGADAIAVASKGFRGRTDLSAAAAQSAHFGIFHGPDGAPIDQVVATVFKAPHSYTGEHVVEISCHGGIVAPRAILEALLAYGARLADPGEYTKRAFLNGRMDLSQAEAVADLIHARSERYRRNSLRQLEGELGKRIRALRDSLVETAGLLELELDFAEEGIELAEKAKVSDQVRRAIGDINDLIGTYHTGRLYRDGVKVVLAGMPNVGKSSLLNALLKEQRAIVTDIPGTTRDTIEESLLIDGLAFRIVDTAGLREAVDRVEQEGVRRSRDQINSSDLVILVLDGSGHPEPEELELAQRLAKDLGTETHTILAFNKIDLGSNRVNGAFKKAEEAIGPSATVRISALTGQGLDTLRAALVKVALAGHHAQTESSLIITNARHLQVLRRAQESLELALKSLKDDASPEFITVDIRAALDALGEITGAVTTDDVLNEIFGRFCIGK